jgi:hypothetical protein
MGRRHTLFVIEAPASEETLAFALNEAVRLIGLRAEQGFAEGGRA